MAKTDSVSYSKLRSQSRINLASSIPLRAPLTVFVEPTNVCNMRCGFCPESLPDFRQKSGYLGQMTPETWSILREQLWAWGVVLKSMKFYGMGEPTLNPNMSQMIRSAITWGVTERTELTTNGTMLKSFGRDLIESGLQYLRVSIYGTSDASYRSSTDSRFTMEMIRENVRSFFELRKTLDRGPYIVCQMTSHFGEEAEFRREFTDICDEALTNELHNWGGSESQLVQLGKSTGRQVCPKPFYELMIHANGDVSPCCIDWNGLLNVGNIHLSSLKDIWEGDRLRLIQEFHLNRRRNEVAACCNCTMIDQQVDRLE